MTSSALSNSDEADSEWVMVHRSDIQTGDIVATLAFVVCILPPIKRSYKLQSRLACCSALERVRCILRIAMTCAASKSESQYGGILALQNQIDGAAASSWYLLRASRPCADRSV